MGSSDNRITGYEPIWLLCECDQLGPRQHNVQPLAGDCDENASVAAHTGAAVALPHRCHGSAIGWSRTLPGAASEGDCAYGAGAAADVIARIAAQKLSEDSGTQFYVENLPGAGGVTGTLAASRAPADGYTLLVVNQDFV